VRVELREITKRFGSFTANDSISLTVEPGQIHCLLGENGAGKSTLMNVVFGLLHPDRGEILLDGEPVRFANSGEAVRRGIGMVHQHFMLVPVFSVAENVVLGFEPTKSLNRLDHDRARREIRELSERFGLDVDPDAVVETLPVGIQQRVEILKALSHDARLLILDEPTAVLTPQEIDALMGIMRSLAAAGTSILFITHKLKEVRAVADVITVIRQGRVIDSVSPDTSEADLAALMVGRSVSLTVAKDAIEVGGASLELRDVVVRDDRGLVAVDHVSLSVREGEIVALAGVQGNGQTELAEAIAGMRHVESGQILLGGRDVTNRSPREILDEGLGHVPEDRHRDGLVLSMSVADNLVLNTPRRAPFARRGTRQLSAVADNARDLVQRFDIRTTGIDASASSLSGGNQQKVIVARELSRPLVAFMASQPTRGLDVGSIEYVHRQIVAERNAGRGILIISSELDEVLALGDRIAVMYSGRITGVVDSSTSREDIGLLMAGAGREH
jgi:simple sugar transport system ATP-binding protein